MIQIYFLSCVYRVCSKIIVNVAGLNFVLTKESFNFNLGLIYIKIARLMHIKWLKKIVSIKSQPNFRILNFFTWFLVGTGDLNRLFLYQTE